MATNTRCLQGLTTLEISRTVIFNECITEGDRVSRADVADEELSNSLTNYFSALSKLKASKARSTLL